MLVKIQDPKIYESWSCNIESRPSTTEFWGLGFIPCLLMTFCLALHTCAMPVNDSSNITKRLKKTERVILCIVLMWSQPVLGGTPLPQPLLSMLLAPARRLALGRLSGGKASCSIKQCLAYQTNTTIYYFWSGIMLDRTELGFSIKSYLQSEGWVGSGAALPLPWQ